MTEEQSRPDEVQNEATPEELDDVVGGKRGRVAFPGSSWRGKRGTTSVNTEPILRKDGFEPLST